MTTGRSPAPCAPGASAGSSLAAARPLAFVGSHPMAGSEQAGYRVSRADLFRGATVIITPTERTDSHAVKRVAEFWEALGGRLVTLDPVTHDRVHELPSDALAVRVAPEVPRDGREVVDRDRDSPRGLIHDHGLGLDNQPAGPTLS